MVLFGRRLSAHIGQNEIILAFQDISSRNMAPPSRPIVAISASGAVTRYHSKRAASAATGIPPASVALAAANLALRDGFLWKFEDDTRPVDMSRFQVDQQQVLDAPTEADVERARDFVDALRGDDGRMITEMRLSDGYISATKMCQSAGKTMSDYMRLQGTNEFLEQLADSLRCPKSNLTNRRETGHVEDRGTWVHPRLAIHLASWCSPSFAVKVTELVLRYLSGQITTEESRAAAAVVNERAAPPDEEEEETRTLKRQRVLNEIELEKVKHANEMAKAQYALLNTLATDVAPPSLTGMINIARNNLAIKSLAILGAIDATITTGSELPAAVQPVTAARRVTVQEFGRDILGLRGDALATKRLAIVGTKLGKLWNSQAGKADIRGFVSETGKKLWRRRFLNDGVTYTSVFPGPLDDTMLANNRIKFSAAYLGTNEIGNGQAYDVWTYQLNEAENLMREAFQD